MQIIFLTFLFLKYSSASIDKKTLEILDNLKEFEEYQRPPDQKSPDDFSDNERYQRIPRGHLKPIGANMDPMEVEILDHLPDSVTFYEEYVRQSRPVIFRGAAERMETYNDWKSDDVLKLVLNIYTQNCFIFSCKQVCFYYVLLVNIYYNFETQKFYLWKKFLLNDLFQN